MYAELTLKQCSRCKEKMNLDRFTNNKGSKDGKDHYCRICKSAVKKEDYLKNRDRIKKQVHESYKRNKEKALIRAKIYRTVNRDKVIAQKRFALTGVTAKQYNEAFVKQKGKCAICGKHSSEFRMRLAADHCHKSKKFRGLLCGYCNTALGLFKDDATLIRRGIEYLRKYQN